jgi:hypothetical protein
MLMILGNRIGGREDLREDQNQKKIEKLFNAIDHRLPISSTMAVIRLSDENWKNWVGEFIERADAVIMDVTHLNQNLGWELNACREKLLPGNMILACCRDKDSREDPWLVLEPELNRYLGAGFLSGCQKFTYYKPPNIFKLINKFKFPGMSQGIRQRQAWYLRKKYERDLLTSISEAFAEKDKFRKQA